MGMSSDSGGGDGLSAEINVTPMVDVLLMNHLAKAVHPASHLLLVGDVLFAGSIGRTDLPGGSYLYSLTVDGRTTARTMMLLK